MVSINTFVQYLLVYGSDRAAKECDPLLAKATDFCNTCDRSAV